MLWSIAKFEFRARLRRLSTYVYFVMFFAIAFLLMMMVGGAFQSVRAAVGGSGGKTLVNSPFVLATLIGITSYFGLLVSAATTAQAIFQDFQHNTFPLFFTTPITRLQYLGGRLLGALASLVVIFSSLALGCWIGSLMPFLDRELFGPNRLAAYVQPYLVTVIPNFVIAGALFFSLAALTRRILPVYVTSVVLLVGYLIALSLTDKIEYRVIASLLDPFGLHAIDQVTEYWTVTERNSQLVPLAGVMLYNRLIWLTVSGAVFGFTLWRFRFEQGNEGRRARRPTETAASRIAILRTTPSRSRLQAVDDGSGGLLSRDREGVVRAAPNAAISGTIPATPPRFNPLRCLTSMTWLAFRETVKNIYFIVIVLGGVLFMIFASRSAGSIYGTETYPVTATVLQFIGSSFTLFVLIIITFYSGELVWRERDAEINQLYDVLPIPNWLPLASKVLALLLVQVVLLTVVMVCGIGIQTFQGYFHYELNQYVKQLFGVQLIEYALMSLLAVAVHVLVNHKYVGHFVMVLYYLATTFMGRFGFEHHLYDYGGNPGYTYSDMNGFGHFLRGIAWFDAYWSACALALAVVSNLFWVRGLEVSGIKRLGLARARFTPAAAAALALFTIAFAGLGGFIFYNTNVLNDYKTSYDREREAADYERAYKRYEDTVQPRVTGVEAAFDVFPETRDVIARGTLRLQNKSAEPIETVFMNMMPDMEIRRLAVGGLAQSTTADKRLGFYTFKLPTPLQPGELTTLQFEFEQRSRGFRNDSRDTQIVHNGTFFNSEVLPHLGYQQGRELGEDSSRRKYGLGPKPRMADVLDLNARRNNYISSDADWVTLDVTVSTTPDQIAIVPGYLVREWQADGRRYFRYKTRVDDVDSQSDGTVEVALADRKRGGSILHFFSVLSARYEVCRDQWNGVAIEIYYHRGHEYNLNTMIQSIKDSLDYFTVQFSPYQHRQVRILEFPRYASFAQSFPNTIPYSEAIGFIARVDPNDPDDIDYPYYVTSHEVAHQWWAHQVIGGNVQGATLLSETLAQYSALMVMKRKFGEAQMKRFLSYESDRYLRGRAFERKKELPLARNENQPYIHYNKGSIVMYALQDYIGEETLNRALAEYIRAVAYQDPPYTNSVELIDQIRRVTPDDLKYLIEDMFETITLYDNRAISADYKETAAGGYEVHLTVEAHKYQADELGVETEQPLDDLVDIGVLDAKGRAVYLEKRRIPQGRSEFTLQLSELPVKAGIDPLNKLIDRKPGDNVVRVQQK